MIRRNDGFLSIAFRYCQRRYLQKNAQAAASIRARQDKSFHYFSNGRAHSTARTAYPYVLPASYNGFNIHTVLK
jgi:hypothetical protein